MFKTQKLPNIPFLDIKLKLSKDVWYSLYVPYFDLIIEQKGKFIFGLQNCLSSLPIQIRIFFIFKI